MLISEVKSLLLSVEFDYADPFIHLRLSVSVCTFSLNFKLLTEGQTLDFF